MDRVVDVAAVTPLHAAGAGRRAHDIVDRLGVGGDHWRAVVERSPVVTWVSEFDELGTLRYVSPHIEQLLGHPREAFQAGQDPERGGLWERLIHPDDREHALATFRDRHP